MQKLHDKGLQSENVDISQYPKRSPHLDEGCASELTLGDTHGGVLKAIFFLMKYGVMELGQSDYEDLVALFLFFDQGDYSDETRTRNHLQHYSQILNRAKINTNHAVRFMGDEVADRRGNDYLTLLLVKKLVDAQLDLEIILSNHSLEFIGAVERVMNEKHNTLKAPCLPNQYTTSMQNLNTLIAQKIVDMDDVLELYGHYKKTLKLFGYSKRPEQNAMDFYSHAPVGVNVLKGSADKLGVNFDLKGCASLESLAKTIDGINQSIAQSAQSNCLHALFAKKGIVNAYNMRNFDAQKFPLELALANFQFDKVSRPDFFNGIAMTYLHGHEEKTPDCGSHCITLDTPLGLHSGDFKGELLVYCANRTVTKRHDQVMIQAAKFISSPVHHQVHPEYDMNNPLVSDTTLTM